MAENFKKKEISEEVIKTFMEGHDPQERIVNLDYSYKDDFISVYYRNENDQKCISKEPYYPFLWAKRSACLELCNGDRNTLKHLLSYYNIGVKALDTTDLEGNQCEEMQDGYTFMFFAKQKMSYSKFLDFFKECGVPVYSDKKGKDNNTPTAKKDDKRFLCVTPQEQFLISTGKRFFKGYEDYNEVLRMIFDLETEGLDPTKDRIKLDGIRMNRPVTIQGHEYQNFERIFRIEGNTEAEKNASELKVIDTMFRIIYTFQPDIITAHNGENFDWNFIIKRCEMLGTSIEKMSAKYFNGKSIGKNNRESVLKLGGEMEHFRQTIVPGIIVTDSLHAVRRAQATDSSFKQADLKYATKYLNLVKPNRVYVPGDIIDKTLCDLEEHYAFNDENGDWYIYDPTYITPENVKKKDKSKKVEDKFILVTRNTILDGYILVSGKYIVERYLYDDLWECDKVEYSLNGTDFMISKLIPVSFQKACTMGTAGQWKMIMLAWSYENNLAIPFSEDTGSFCGGLSRLLKTGFVGQWADINGEIHGEEIDKLDFNSLYPSIILTWGIEDKKDLMGVTLKMLEYILTTRELHKSYKKKAGKIVDKFEERINNGEKLSDEDLLEYNKQKSIYKVEDNRQACVKRVGNSYFGAYGSNNGSVYPWKSPSCAERTTCTGRQCLRLMISHFSEISEHNNLNDKDYNYIPIVGDTDGFNFQLPKKFRYTEEHPYISNGLSRLTKEGKKYIGDDGDIAEFNDRYMIDFHYSPNAVQKMGLDRDEIAHSTINFSRKNYADYFPWKPYPDDVKFVGNTIKSKKLPAYLSNFLDGAIRLLLQGKGQEFLEEYYAYIEKIYNYQIPLREIASKGKIKKSVSDYILDCKTITKAGRPKSRQAHMELCLKYNLNPNLGETIYYINTGKSKSQADVKKVTHYYITSDGMFGEEKSDVKVKLEKEWKGDTAEGKGKMEFNDYVKLKHPEVKIEEEIILNCEIVPNEILNSEADCYCEEGKEYNVAKYIEQFNKRITPLLVCFSKDIRSKILITNPADRPYFTAEESVLCSGEPNKPGDQDTYEQLMTMEDKEIKFWKAHPEWKIPFLKECGMDWDKIVSDYDERKERERQLGIDKIRESYETVLSNLTADELDAFEDGVMPSKLNNIIEIDPLTNNFVAKEYPEIVIGNIYDILEQKYNNNQFTEEEEIFE